jgi:hypothetical protein
MILESYDCELCILQKEERVRHIFYRHPFAKNCWNSIGITVPTWLKPERASRHSKKVPKSAICSGYYHNNELVHLD